MDDRETRSAGGRPYKWVATNGPHGGMINMRLQPDDDGRLVVTGLLVEGVRITADFLRLIQPARVEAGFNLLASLRESPGDTLDPGPDDGLTLGEIRGQAYGVHSGSTIFAAHPDYTPDRQPLRRPDGSDPDTFYQEVAQAYRSAAMESQRPAAVLAEEAGVPVTTVHRWIREARRRGSLPPGRKGTAG
ncbi:hypothetical protein AB0F17_63490 [Nonomuraea sp. NPDC026600]|uniref:hypothetical protein n=1 Tax=Nonomuraea sp. NPDC026600 TaxID=3155363 RepID=UPI0033CF7AAD